MSRVNLGLIGCGGRLRGLVRELLHGRDDLCITAFADPSEASREATRQMVGDDVKAYEDYRRVVGSPEVDWVMIGSPNHLHREQAVAAMEAGKHVFCEKPLAISFEDCLAMRDAQQRTGVKFFIGLTLRYSPHYVRIKQLLDEGQIGRIVSMEFNETLEFNHGGYIHQDWRRFTRLAGSHVLEKCCHDIDVANWLADSLPTRVASFGGLNFFTPENAHHVGRVGPDPATGNDAFHLYAPRDGAGKNPFTVNKDIVDNQVAILEYASHVRASFHTNCSAGQHERRNYLVGTEGTIQADMVTGRIHLKRIGWNTPTVVYSTVGGTHGSGHGGSDAQLIVWLSRCILEDADPRAGIEEGMKSAITCFAIDQAMRSGAVVDLAEWWQKAGIELEGLTPVA